MFVFYWDAFLGGFIDFCKCLSSISSFLSKAGYVTV